MTSIPPRGFGKFALIAITAQLTIAVGLIWAIAAAVKWVVN